mmetsp:Transcript_26652/g.88452  ORF Transcript_26652/g.88452 Transcript_26652/m.88452 type:complete len:203 (+) Transcript_26652:17-625(+)
MTCTTAVVLPQVAPRVGKWAFDCKSDFDRWLTRWSLRKASWCCQHQPRWCPKVGVMPDDEQDSLPTTSTMPKPTTSATSVSAEGRHAETKSEIKSTAKHLMSPSPSKSRSTTTPPCRKRGISACQAKHRSACRSACRAHIGGRFRGQGSRPGSHASEFVNDRDGFHDQPGPGLHSGLSASHLGGRRSADDLPRRAVQLRPRL